MASRWRSFELIASRTGAVPDAETADLTVSLGREQIARQIVHLERQRDDLDAAIGELQEAMKRMMESVA